MYANEAELEVRSLQVPGCVTRGKNAPVIGKKAVTSHIPVRNPGSDVIRCYGREKLCENLYIFQETVKLLQETRFVDEMSLQNRFTLSNSQVLQVFLIVSDFCTSFPNLVDHRSAYLWPTSFERRGDVMWKSCLFPTCAIQLSGEVLSTDEAASAELRKAEAAHRTRNSHRLFKAAPTTPCIC